MLARGQILECSLSLIESIYPVDERVQSDTLALQESVQSLKIGP
jgi:hypothetical protein